MSGIAGRVPTFLSSSQARQSFLVPLHRIPLRVLKCTLDLLATCFLSRFKKKNHVTITRVHSIGFITETNTLFFFVLKIHFPNYISDVLDNIIKTIMNQKLNTKSFKINKLSYFKYLMRYY